MWAGGKKKMLKRYRSYLPEKFDKYCEPFLGGGAMFIWAYEKNPQASFVLNDSNEGVVQIYRTIRNDVTKFIARLDMLSEQYLPLSKEDRKVWYYDLRNEHAYDYHKWTSTEEAASLYFLMKTGFNGIWQINKNTNDRFGTPSGLLNQKDTVYDKQNVMKWHEALQQCELMCGDFQETIKRIGRGSNCYVFLDPPYRGSFTQYGVDFDDRLQEQVITYLEVARMLGSYVLLSNRDVGDHFFENRSGENKIVKFPVTYTAGRRKKTEEGFEAKKATEILMIGEPRGL